MPAEINAKIAATKTALVGTISALSPTIAPSETQKDAFASLLAVGNASNILKQFSSEKSSRRDDVRKPSQKEDDQNDVVAAAVSDPQAVRDDRKPSAPKSEPEDVAAVSKAEAPAEADANTAKPEPQENVASKENAAPSADNKTASTAADTSQEVTAVATTAVAAPQALSETVPQETSLENMLKAFQVSLLALLQLLKDQGFIDGATQQAFTDSNADASQFVVLLQNQAINSANVSDPKLKPFFDALENVRSGLGAFTQLFAATQGSQDTLSIADQANARRLLASLKTDIASLQQATQNITASPKNDEAFQNVLEKLKALSGALNNQAPAQKAQTSDVQTAPLTQASILSFAKETAARTSAPEVIAATPAASLQTQAPSVSAHNDNLVAAAVTAAASTSANSDSAGEKGGQSNNSNSGLTQVSPVQGTSAASSTSSLHAPNFARILTQQANQPLAEQVMVHIKTAIKDGSSKINIQLHPEDLGKLEIKLHVSADGKTGVTIIADNKDTLAMLQKDASGLERALSDAGLRADAGGLNFNLRGGKENNSDHSQASSNYQKALPEEEEILPTNVLSRSYVVNLAEGLDIKI